MPKKPHSTEVSLAPELIDQIDQLVGQARRSQFLTEAALEKIERIQYEQALAAIEASFRDVNGGWASAEEATRWVRQQRQAFEHRVAKSTLILET